MQTNSSNGQLTAQISMSDHNKSGFDLSNNVLGTGKIGRIIPTRALHVMPGDTIKQDSKVAVQFEPLAVPILANMDVRQEHFYVPYNIVWKNWDKFISSGEKLDYHGVVPNISFLRVVDSVLKQFDEANGINLSLPLLIGVPDKETGLNEAMLNGDYYFSNQYFTDLHEAVDIIGEKFEIKDLLKYMHEAVDLMHDKINNDISNIADVPLFVLSNNRISLLDYLQNNTEKFTNKYHDDLMPVYMQLLENDGFVAIPTDYCIEWLNLLYEIVKPLFGIGSNLDYLNMGRITMQDFVYVFTRIATPIINARVQEEQVVSLNFTYFSQLPISVLNLRANYNIWYNNYRDILLEANAFEPYDGDDISDDELFVLLVPRQRCWEKDAFTTALDNPGTGNVGVPVGMQSYTIEGYKAYTQKVNTDIQSGIFDTSDVNANDVYKVSMNGETWYLPTAYLTGINEQQDGENEVYHNGFSLYQLDAAQRAQKWLQKALFFGNRISDFYYMHFGVRFLDARLRLPELLTSSKELVKLDVVMNNTNITTEANGEVYQSIAGDRAAYASAYDNGNSFDRFCEEHGVIMSYLTIMPQITYAYGINRDYSRLDMFDFAFSEFATLGMDAVYDSEITAISVNLPDAGNDVKVFGYQGKYYDYKAKHSEEHGELLDSQDMYTFARKFNMYDPNGRPKLNYEFVHCFPSLDMFVVDSTLADYFRYDIRHSTAAERNLPSQSIYI